MALSKKQFDELKSSVDVGEAFNEAKFSGTEDVEEVGGAVVKKPFLSKKFILPAAILSLLFGASCEKPAAGPEGSTDPVKVDKYIEWNYEAGKDPLPIQLFTFPTGANPATSFDISDTTKVEDIFAGHLNGTDRLGQYRELDMTKNSWDDQVLPGVPVDVGGHEFSAAERDALFAGVKFTNIPSENILARASSNLVNIYNSKIKPELNKKAEAYFKVHNKKPKYQVSVLTVPLEYYESGYGGTAIKMSDDNVVVLTVEPSRAHGILESMLSMYGQIGHEFAGHILNNDTEVANSAGKVDQFNNQIDGFGHVNNEADRGIFNSGISNHLRTDVYNNSMLFPQAGKEYLSAKGSKEYGDLKLLRMSTEPSNVPYIANMVQNKQNISKEFMKNMWTGKQLVNSTVSGGRMLSIDNEPATIVSIHSCK